MKKVRLVLCYYLNINFNSSVKFLVILEIEDKVMIAVISIFGVLLFIGTTTDTILNIMHLDIVPERLLEVQVVVCTFFFA